MDFPIKLTLNSGILTVSEGKGLVFSFPSPGVQDCLVATLDLSKESGEGPKALDSWLRVMKLRVEQTVIGYFLGEVGNRR